MNTMNSSSLRPSYSVALRVDDPTCVCAADIERLDIIHALLSELNDPRASAVTLAPFIDAFPPLRARIGRAFELRRPNSRATNIAAQIVCLGNREVEMVLLELLEDLTMLRAELLEAAENR
jgi:hypothetical protein